MIQRATTRVVYSILREDKVYGILDCLCCNGTVIKKLNPGRDESEVLCASINPDYQPFSVKPADVYGLYRVIMCMTLK